MDSRILYLKIAFRRPFRSLISYFHLQFPLVSCHNVENIERIKKGESICDENSFYVVKSLDIILSAMISPAPP